MRIHLIGACGTGMGTLAGMLRHAGHEVTGSDTTSYPPMSDLLAAWGIPLLPGWKAENITPGIDLVVVGNVCRRDNPEAVAAAALGLRTTSLPAALAEVFIEGRHGVVVAGTHGKTTTTSLLGWLLTSARLDPGLFVGGVPLNFGVSFRLGSGPHFVVEGDEYDSAFFDKGPKFLHYRPSTVLLTSVEYDHADIYPSLDAVKEAFRKLMRLLPPDGRLVCCSDWDNVTEVATEARCPKETYGVKPGAAWRPVELEAGEGGTSFTLLRDGSAVGRFLVPMYGEHNVLNATGAMATALSLGVSPRDVDAGLRSFKGIRKRQEVKGEVRGVMVIDDFAHHPTAVRETVRAIRMRYPSRRLWALFEAESNTSRRRVFQQDYAPAFEEADAVVFCSPLRKASDTLSAEQEIDIPAIVAEINERGGEAHYIADVAEIARFVASEARPGDVVLAMSGRNFRGLHALLLDTLGGM